MTDHWRSLAILPLGATLLPLIRTGRGWVRIWDFPRPQLAALATAALGGSFLDRKRTAADRILRLALGGCIAYQASKMIRYSPFYPKTVLPTSRNRDREISLLISNVYMYNRNVSALLSVVRESDPDIICLVETDERWVAGLTSLTSEYPHQHLCPLGNTYGMLLYSRLPVVRCDVRYLVEPDIPSMHARIRLCSGQVVALYCLHPRPPLPGTSSYGRDAELVLVGKEIAGDPTPAIVAGDLNDVAWSHTTTLFQRISGTLDPRVGRGLFNSFHARYPLLRYPLDHIFHSPHFKVAELRRLRDIGSDHFPILARLVFTPEAETQQDAPDLTHQAVEDAEEILDDARREISR